MSNNSHMLRLDRVSQWYPSNDGSPKIVFQDLTLNVSHGELVTLVGPSGCGKSTLLRLILGWEQPKTGSVSIDEVDASLPNRDRGIVFQKYSLFPHLTVLENVILGLELEQIPFLWKWLWYPGYMKKHKEWKQEAMQFLERMKLSEHAYKYPFELSGGMQQRVAIAQALIMKPKILLMDEPFGALDPGTREEMQVFLLELWEQFKMTIFFVTHDLEEAVFLGTRVVVLSPYFLVDPPEIAVGSRIITDRQLAGALSTRVKASADFGKVVREIKQKGFSPENRVAIHEFDLSHSEAWPQPRKDVYRAQQH